jgi:hypothetical protein
MGQAMLPSPSAMNHQWQHSSSNLKWFLENWLLLATTHLIKKRWRSCDDVKESINATSHFVPRSAYITHASSNISTGFKCKSWVQCTFHYRVDMKNTEDAQGVSWWRNNHLIITCGRGNSGDGRFIFAEPRVNEPHCVTRTANQSRNQQQADNVQVQDSFPVIRMFPVTGAKVTTLHHAPNLTPTDNFTFHNTRSSFKSFT